MLNRYFRDYFDRRGQGGTNAQQRNLLQLFNFLQREYGHPHPYTDDLNRYAEVKGRPKTLAADFVSELLEVTGGGKARSFEDARDHAIICVLRSEGIRRCELLGMVMHSLPADVIRDPLIRLVPVKGARAAGEGRLVTLAPATARALAAYLRVRRKHTLADSDWVWLGTRGRGRFSNTGIRKMLVRRAEQAGYTQVTPHQFRHTFSDGWQMGRIASGASFRQLREHALPAAQRAALPRTARTGARDGAVDLRFHGRSGSDATMMRLVLRGCVHHGCGYWHIDAFSGAGLHLMHHHRSGRGARIAPPQRRPRRASMARASRRTPDQGARRPSLRRMHLGSR
jgi:site-specific recombinase XerD